MKFKYKSQTKTGQITEGIIEASDKFALAREIKQKGEIILAVDEIKGGLNGLFLKINGLLGSVTLAEKIRFAKNLSGMISAGVSLPRALAIFNKQTKNQIFKNILDSLINTINSGGTLSLGMKKHPKVFSELFVSMVRAGEESGGLPKALLEIADNLKKTYTLRKKIKGAMTYPIVIFSAMVLIGILMLIYVVPTLTKTFTDIGADLPASTKFVIWLSDFIKNNLLVFVLCIFGLIGLFILLVKLPKTKKFFDYIVIKLPVIGTIIKEINSARTARTFSSLLSSGVDISKALKITEEVLQNYYYKNLIEQAIISIEKGATLSSVFKSHPELYPIMVGEMMEVGEETGKLSSMLVDIATFYEEEVDAKTKDLSTIIEPLLMIVIGAAVGFFAVSMLQPMYSVMENIK